MSHQGVKISNLKRALLQMAAHFDDNNDLLQYCYARAQSMNLSERMCKTKQFMLCKALTTVRYRKHNTT